MLAAESEAVFGRSWLPAARTDQLSAAGDYVAGSAGALRYLTVRSDDGQLRAFHNVCRHNAAAVAAGCGRAATEFTCPYHGWTYDTSGRLRKATRLAGIERFSARDYGLRPLQSAAWGPFVLVNAADSPARQPGGGVEAGGGFEDLVADAAPALAVFSDPGLLFVARREYRLRCNWKVFCNNYLDGGYHVPHAHKALASGVDMATYRTDLYGLASVQSVALGAAAGDRLRFSGAAPPGGGERATYAFIYPNFMLNRYGPWMDTNVVVPVGTKECSVVFEYFVHESLAADTGYLERCMADSAQVQQEDISLCEDVQRGLESLSALAGGADGQPVPSGRCAAAEALAPFRRFCLL